MKIPRKYLIQNGFGKYILREAVKGILNENVRLSREKKGFNASLNSLVDFRDHKTLSYLLGDGPVWELVNRDRISTFFSEKPLSNSRSKFLFNFINCKIFLEMR